MNNFFNPSTINDHASSLRSSLDTDLSQVFVGGSFDAFTKPSNSGRTAKRVRVGGPVMFDDFRHPLSEEGGFWGVNGDNGEQLLRRYDPAAEPIDLTGEK